MKLILFILLLLSLFGCASSPVVVTPDTRILDSAVEAAEESLDALEDGIPPIYLSKCLWMIQLENDSLEELNYVMKTNSDRFRECYLIHNSLIDVLTKDD